MQKLLVALSVLMIASAPLAAQTGTAPGSGDAGQARPARGPDQTSVPSAAPAATTQQTTGTSSQSPAVTQMNEAEKRKVEEKGK